LTIAQGKSLLSTPLLQLRYEDNGTGHDDLVLYFGDHRLVGDSYYLSLDMVEADNESPEKTARVLARLLEQWLVYVENGVSGEICYLPFDFSDQSTGWLRCVFDNGLVELQPGAAPTEGWSLMPSQIRDHVERVEDFEPLDGVDPIRLARGLLELELTISIREAGSGLATGRRKSDLSASCENTDSTLDQLQIGERGVVIKVTGDTDLIANCRNNGLTNGAELVLLCFGDSGQQVEFEISGAQHTLNRDVAASVKIKRIF
jgi:Fe2+ transport system protein FeoA